MYDSTLRVPLILYRPGSTATGRRVKAVAGLIDVAPTILDLLHLPISPQMAGRSLLEDPPNARELLIESVLPAESYGWSPLSGIVDGRFKFIQAPRPELYDLIADPHETNNLWSPSAATSRRLAKAHAAALSQHTEPAGSTRAIDREEAQALRSLGYVFGASASAGGGIHSDAPDPKSMVEWARIQKRAAVLIANRRFDEARAPLERLLIANPQSYDAHWMLAEVELKSGRVDRAEELFARARDIRPEKAQALIGLGQIARAEGDSERAFRLFTEATEDPASFDAFLNLAVTWLDRGSIEQAIATLEQARRLHPYAAKVHYSLALLYQNQSRSEDARAAASRAVQLQPSYTPARELLAELAGGGGREPASTAAPGRVPIPDGSAP